MSFFRKLSVDATTIAAGCVLWLFGFFAALLLPGAEIGPTLFWTFLVACFLCLCFVLAGDQLQRFVSTPSRAFFFLACGMLVALVSFGTDCIVGLTNSSDLSLFRACAKPGVGALFTAALACCAIGVPLVGILRATLAAVWRPRRQR